MSKSNETKVKKRQLKVIEGALLLGQVFEIVTLDTDKKSRIDLCNALLQKAQSLINLNDCIDYLKFVSKNVTYNLKESQVRM